MTNGRVAAVRREEVVRAIYAKVCASFPLHYLLPGWPFSQLPRRALATVLGVWRWVDTRTNEAWGVMNSAAGTSYFAAARPVSC